MRKCYLITLDPHFARLARLEQIVRELGYRMEILPRVLREGMDENDLVVIDIRSDARDVLAQFGGFAGLRRRTRTIVIMQEQASAEQRAECLDAGVLSAVPANPVRLADLLAQVIREVTSSEWPWP